MERVEILEEEKYQEGSTPHKFFKEKERRPSSGESSGGIDGGKEVETICKS